MKASFGITQGDMARRSFRLGRPLPMESAAGYRPLQSRALNQWEEGSVDERGTL